MKKSNDQIAEGGLTRRNFMKGGAGAVLAISCLHGLELHAMASATNLSHTAARTHICPPCGQPCDKLTFDQPGNCPQCGMTLIPADGEGGPPKVAMLVYNGVEIIDIAGPWEVFGAAGFLVHTVAEKPEPLTLVYGQKIVPDYTFTNSPKADILLVPGGGYGSQMNNAATIGWIKSKANEVKYVMSVCTGAFLLGQAGLLSGQTATCTYGMVEDLTAFPNTKVVYDARFVESGKIITTAGLTSGIDGALHLISKMLGKGAAQSAALGIEYRWSPDTAWARGAMADRFLPDGLAYGGAKLKGAEATMISTEGDATRWETRILVSDPKNTSGRHRSSPRTHCRE
ncbi:MAG TPA: DJ-1/PfpI family protein [Pyrinomonadaceae bacterium]|nr:DJ-1/PfpI family protein [Pyrinomonadaceae bacterium]